MAETELAVSAETARRFLVRAFALAGPPSLPDVPAVLDRLEFVQEDSINVCGRIHDLILWSRVRDYTPATLSSSLYDHPRSAFEYYFPNLCVLPIRDFPYFAPAMRRQRGKYSRWGHITDEELPVVAAIEEILDGDEGGVLRTREAGAAHGHTTSGWGTRTRLMAHVADKLWLHGRLGIARRENFERSFDRIERLFPEDILAATLPDEAEEKRYLARKRLRAKRLFRAKRDDVALLGKDALRTVRIEGVRRPWQILVEDADTLVTSADAPAGDAFHLLAPLDPLVYDRERNRDLFDFDYTWEVYTPAAKRRWGYYALPILQGERLIGRVDPKIDRRTGTLTLHSLYLEPGVEVEEIVAPLRARLHDFARFLSATRIEVTQCDSPPLRDAISGALT